MYVRRRKHSAVLENAFWLSILVQHVDPLRSSPWLATMQYHQAVPSRVLAAEFLTKVGPLLIVVAYAPNDQDSTEEKDRFYSPCDEQWQWAGN